jgi:hypothetical protein
VRVKAQRGMRHKKDLIRQKKDCVTLSIPGTSLERFRHGKLFREVLMEEAGVPC